MTAHPAHSLAWTLDSAAMAAWLAAAVSRVAHVGDTGGDGGADEEVVSGWSADRRADAEEDRRWRTLP